MKVVREGKNTRKVSMFQTHFTFYPTIESKFYRLVNRQQTQSILDAFGSKIESGKFPNFLNFHTFMREKSNSEIWLDFIRIFSELFLDPHRICRAMLKRKICSCMIIDFVLNFVLSVSVGGEKFEWKSLILHWILYFIRFLKFGKFSEIPFSFFHFTFMLSIHIYVYCIWYSNSIAAKVLKRPDNKQKLSQEEKNEKFKHFASLSPAGAWKSFHFFLCFCFIFVRCRRRCGADEKIS